MGSCRAAVSDAWASGDVTNIGTDRRNTSTGGLLGFASGPVTRCYATGNVIGYKAVGGIVGVAGAMVFLGFSGLAVGADAVTISFTPSLRLALSGLAAAVVTGLLAGLAPAWQAARTDIVPALRQA